MLATDFWCLLGVTPFWNRFHVDPIAVKSKRVAKPIQAIRVGELGRESFHIGCPFGVDNRRDVLVLQIVVSLCSVWLLNIVREPKGKAPR